MRKLAIIPAFNEEKNIGRIIAQVKEADPSLDILVVNDCSEDQTIRIAMEQGAHVVSHPINMGYGITLQTGYKYALKHQYDVVVQLDADGQHDPFLIPKLIGAYESGKGDVVIGSRYVEKTGYNTPVARMIGIHFFSFLILLITGKKISDPTSGYRVIGGQVLPLLVLDSFPWDFPDADIIVMLHHAGYRISEYPVEMRRNQEGKSMHNGIFNNCFYIFKMSLSLFLIFISKTIKRRN